MLHHPLGWVALNALSHGSVFTPIPPTSLLPFSFHFFLTVSLFPSPGCHHIPPFSPPPPRLLFVAGPLIKNAAPPSFSLPFPRALLTPTSFFLLLFLPGPASLGSSLFSSSSFFFLPWEEGRRRRRTEQPASEEKQQGEWVGAKQPRGKEEEEETIKLMCVRKTG